MDPEYEAMIQRIFPGAGEILVAAEGSVSEREFHLRRWCKAYGVQTYRPVQVRVTNGDGLYIKSQTYFACHEGRFAVLEIGDEPLPKGSPISIEFATPDGSFEINGVAENSGHSGVVLIEPQGEPR